MSNINISYHLRGLAPMLVVISNGNVIINDNATTDNKHITTTTTTATSTTDNDNTIIPVKLIIHNGKTQTKTDTSNVTTMNILVTTRSSWWSATGPSLRS